MCIWIMNEYDYVTVWLLMNVSVLLCNLYNIYIMFYLHNDIFTMYIIMK